MTLPRALTAAATALETNANELTRLDSISGDGDLGTTAKKVATAIREAVDSNEADAATLIGLCGRRIATTAASSCGTLVATAFLAAAKVTGEGGAREQLSAALAAAVEAIAMRGKASPGDRTMIDALAPAADAASAGSPIEPWDKYLQRISDAATAGTEATRTMTPRIGRARAQPASALGHPDAGAVLVTVALTAALRAVSEARQP